MGVVTIRDMVFVNALERRLGRRLSEEELAEDNDLELVFPDGHREWVMIPRLVFPNDLLSAPELGFVDAMESGLVETETYNEEDIQYSNAG